MSRRGDGWPHHKAPTSWDLLNSISKLAGERVRQRRRPLPIDFRWLWYSSYSMSIHLFVNVYFFSLPPIHTINAFHSFQALKCVYICIAQQQIHLPAPHNYASFVCYVTLHTYTLTCVSNYSCIVFLFSYYDVCGLWLWWDCCFLRVCFIWYKMSLALLWLEMLNNEKLLFTPTKVTFCSNGQRTIYMKQSKQRVPSAFGSSPNLPDVKTGSNYYTEYSKNKIEIQWFAWGWP